MRFWLSTIFCCMSIWPMAVAASLVPCPAPLAAPRMRVLSESSCASSLASSRFWSAFRSFAEVPVAVTSRMPFRTRARSLVYPWRTFSAGSVPKTPMRASDSPIIGT